MHRDHRVTDRLAKVFLSHLAEMFENHGRQFNRGHLAFAKRVVTFCAHAALGGGNGLAGVCHQPGLRDATHKQSIIEQGHDRGRHLAIGRSQKPGRAVFEHSR